MADVKNKHYRDGRVACKSGLGLESSPPREAYDGSVKTIWSHWMDGYYDQYFGEKYEPVGKFIPNRIWPVPL